MRILRPISLALLIISIVFAAATYGSLPDQVPTRLGLSGDIESVSGRSAVMWFMLPGLNVLMFAMFVILGAQLTRKPHWFNFPDKQRFLALPPEYQAPVIVEMRLVLEVALVGVSITMLGVQVLQWRVALGDRPGALALAPLLGVLVTPVLLLFVARVTTATDKAAARWKAESATRRA